MHIHSSTSFSPSLVDPTHAYILRELNTWARQKKVEKKEKKIRGTSHPEKFMARALDGLHRDYIFLLSVGLARKSILVCFLFFLFSEFRIVSHSPFACK